MTEAQLAEPMVTDWAVKLAARTVVQTEKLLVDC